MGGTSLKNILVYTENPCVRTQYIADTLLTNFQGIGVEITHSPDVFLQADNPKFSYLPRGLDHIPNILNSNTIWNDSIYHLTLPKTSFTELKGLHNDTDVLSIGFFLLSRAEEYVSQNHDKHGRYRSSESEAAKAQLLQTPLVDMISEHLVKWLQSFYPDLTSNPKPNRTILTFDIDMAYAILGKPFIRQAGGTFLELISGHFSKLKDRIQILQHKKSDPFDVYRYLEKLAAETGLPMIFFFNMCSHGRFDKAINTKHKMFRNLVQRVSEFAEIGLHPSYIGGQNAETIIAEKQILENITGREIQHSRQHFLKLHIPKTVRALARAGIKNDYTMGFAETPGWRAGTTKPFRIFDIQQNAITTVTTHPISFMDGTLREYLDLTPEKAIQQIFEIKKITEQHSGIFIPLWHNETISETGKWKQWRSCVFEPMIEQIIKNQT